MFRRTAGFSTVVVASALAMAACRETQTPVAPRAVDASALSSQSSDQATQPDPAALARAIPGFGGYFFDDDGALTVYLTDPTQRGAMQRALTSYALAHGISPSAIKVKKGGYDWQQLDGWFGAATRQALPQSGVIFTDLDETNNRVLVAVEDPASAGRARAALASAGIPASALSIEVREPVTFASTLQDKVRPIVAGLQINFPGFLCTLGFNARDGTQDSFITASHCTNTQGGVENTPYWQPLQSVDNTVIATEVEDPTYFSGGVCPAGKVCRYSDASRARYSTGFTSFTLGAIARTANTHRSLDIVGTFSITGTNAAGGAVGEVANKVGRTTGWSQGKITNSCVNTGVSGTNIVQLCQTFVRATVGAGDSGSDVFALSGESAILLGTLWGGNGSRSFVFSPFGQIQQELGTLTVH